MKVEDTLACQISSWYETFKNVTFKSKFINLPSEFISYLLEDGLVLPESCSLPTHPRDSDNDSDEGDWDEKCETKQGPSFPDIDEQIKKAVKSLGGQVFPKLNWSCPKDAVWIAPTKTLECTCPADIYLLLKSSDFIMHDITEPFEYCAETKNQEIQYQLALRRWHSLSCSGEFRCFVKNQKLIGISQRNHRIFYQTVLDNKDCILDDIIGFFTERIQMHFPLQDYVFDVYVKEKGKVYVVDFNVFGPVTDGLLFEWEELCEEKPLGFDLTENTVIKPVFRIIESEGHVQTSTYESYTVPQDFVHLSSGLDPEKLLDFLQLKTQNASDSSTDDEDEQGDNNDETTQQSSLDDKGTNYHGKK